MSNYMVEAKSRANLRSLARVLREHLHLDDVLYFPIVELLDVMTELFDDFNYEVVEDKVLSKKFMQTQISAQGISASKRVSMRARAMVKAETE